MNTATFVLSTGRCGTQWLAQAFAEAFGDRVRVEHEPLHHRYLPAVMLGAGDVSALSPTQARPILRHVEGILATLESRDYFEAGHPCWSSLPWLSRQLGGRIRIVHLVRHPVPTSVSWLSHGAYAPPLLPHLAPKEPITPFAPGVSFPEYRDAWAALAPFERCLYYWAEVNAFGLRLEREGGRPWLRLRYEDLFAARSDPLAALLRFMALPEAVAGSMPRGQQVDQFRYALPGLPAPEAIRRHPRFLALAEQLGYRDDDYAAADLRARFLPAP
jgi:hypothetical protein